MRFKRIQKGNFIRFGIMSEKVETEEAEKWCAQYKNTYFFETSARENINIDKSFLKIAEVAEKNYIEDNLQKYIFF